MKLPIFIFIPLLFLSSCSIFNETWQGAFYKNGDTLQNPEYSQTFSDFASCKNWAINKANSNDKYTCNKNCKSIGNDMQECELVIRNWKINEGSITFDTYK